MFAALILPLLLAIPASAQILQYGSGQLPACAQNCAILSQAQAACVPVPATEKSCFCQSAYLTQGNNLLTNPNAVCTDVCPNQSDRNQIQSWYKSYCQGGTNASPQPSSSSSSAPTSTSAAPTSTGSTSGNSQSFQIQQGNQPSWWSVHGRWIAMVIVLVVAFTIIIIVGVWWKRRHDRKVNLATEDPLPDGWGPPSDPHTYAAAGGEKKRGATSSTKAKPPTQDVEMGRSRKLKKFLGR